MVALRLPLVLVALVTVVALVLALSVAETARATVAPTNPPTFAPSTKPTASPIITVAPSASPTFNLTTSPSTSPTFRPTTRSPTKPTTRAPTKRPTTRSPTRLPTKMPTKRPSTRSPTGKPTRQPTKRPTPPTRTPTRTPTEALLTAAPAFNPAICTITTCMLAPPTFTGTPTFFPTSVGTVIFRSSGCYAGNVAKSALQLAGKCTTTKSSFMPHVTCVKVAAVLSTLAGTALDGIVPTTSAYRTKAVWGPRGLLAPNWDTFIKGPLSNSLTAVGVLQAKQEYEHTNYDNVWTGWTQTGATSVNSCSSMTSSLPSLLTMLGSGDDTNAGWSRTGPKSSCCNIHPILCACFL